MINRQKENLYLDYERRYGPAVLSENKTKHTILFKTILLSTILKKHCINKIDCLKIDVECLEDMALLPFFKTVKKTLYPLHIVIEHTCNKIWTYQDLIRFLARLGYITILKTRSNTCLKLTTNNS